MPQDDISTYAEVCKVDRRLGIVIGYGIVCKERDAVGELQPYFDRDRDGPEHVTEDAMVEASLEFMQSERTLGFMHEDVEKSIERNRGTVVFAFPLTEDVAKALGVTVQRTGLIVGVKPSNPADLAKFESGELKGFSIRGKRVEGKQQDIDDANGAWRDVQYVEAKP